MPSSSPSSQPSLTPQSWHWRGFPITYYQQGDRGPAIVCIHGFGASGLHWRKNLPELAQTCRCYALDLIGFGGSAKPIAGEEIDYTFETWGQQIADFCREVIGEPVFLVGNSIGCVAAMQVAVDNPELVQGVALINCSLRLLHDRKRMTLPWYRQMSAPAMQQLLSLKWVGRRFFSLLARPKTVRRILLQAYARPEAVTDELVEILLAPARDRGAADVFLAFIRYSQGPLPEDLLPVLPCPALVLWGTLDPWEPIELGQAFSQFPPVQQFVPLEGAGHCPQDEMPELVNPLLRDWILQQVAQETGEVVNS